MGMACGICGNKIKKDEKYGICADCGMIFCRSCMEENGGEIPDHDCDPEGDMGDYEW